MHGALPWDTRFQALLSTTYATAVVLHDRACELDQFEPDRIEDPALSAFARERVLVEADSRVEGTAARVEITTVSGETHVDHRAVPKGDAADPLSRAEIQQKFRSAASGILPAAVEQALDLLDGLERVSQLTATLRAPAPARAAMPR